MSKVKEELLLSTIFVGKWLALGLGVVGILYISIYLAYHKSYFDPRMEKFDLEISEQLELKNRLEATRITLNSGLKANKGKADELKTDNFPDVENRINKAKEEIDNLGLKWWEKIPVPMLKKDKKVEAAYNELKIAERARGSINDKLDGLHDEYEKSNKLIKKISNEIQDYEMEISEIERDKKRAQVDVKGPVLWLFSILGLTF